jgi:CBS domain-containing protein
MLLRSKIPDFKIVSQQSGEGGTLQKLVLEHGQTGKSKVYSLDESATRKRKPDEGQGEATGSTTTTNNNNTNVTGEKRLRGAFTEDEYPINSEFVKVLLTQRVEDMRMTEDNKIFVAYRNELATSVFQGLIKHGFLSCPVLNKKGHLHYGFLDIMDFVYFFVGELGKKELSTPGTDVWSILEKQTTFKDKKVKDLMAYPVRLLSPFHPIHKGYSIYAAAETMAREPHLHRIPVIDEQRRLINLITQSQLVHYVFRNLDLLGDRKNKPLSKMPSIFHPVISINADDDAVQAFKLMVEKGITGVAIVDNGTNRRLLGNISTKDLKGVDADGKWLSRLFLPAEAYLQEMKNTFPDLPRPDSPIYALPSDTLETVFRKVVDNKIHRVFVVDNDTDRRPIGVITMKDILREVIL